MFFNLIKEISRLRLEINKLLSNVLNSLKEINKLRKEVNIHKDIFACLFSIHNIISLSCHEQVCLSGLLKHQFNFPYNFDNF